MAAMASASFECSVPVRIPGGNPVMAVPGETAMLPLMTVRPVLVMVELAIMPNDWVAPTTGHPAQVWAPMIALTHMAVIKTVTQMRAPAVVMPPPALPPAVRDTSTTHLITLLGKWLPQDGKKKRELFV